MPGGVPEHQVPDQIDAPQGTPEMAARVPYDNPIAPAVDYAGQMALREQRFADQAAVVGATNKLSDLDQEKLYHPESGLLNQNLGKDAPAAADKTLTDYEEQRSAIRESLGNDRQKMLFDRTSGEHMRTVQRQVFAYEHNQYKQWDQENVAATVANAQTQAVNTYGLPADPGQGDPVDHQVAKQEATLRDYGQREGWPQAMVDLKVADAKSKTYTAVIDDMLAKENTAGALALFDAHSADIQPEQRATVARALKATSTANDAQQIANGFLATAPDREPVTRADFLEKLQADPTLAQNADLYDHVARRGEQFFAMQDAAKRETQQNVASDAYKAMIADPTQSVQAAVGPTQWQQLDGETQRSLLNAQAQMVKREEPTMADPRVKQTYYDLKQLVGKPAFLHENLMNYVDKLPSTEWKEAVGWQEEQAKNGDKSPKLAGVTTNNEIVNNSLHNLSLDRDGEQNGDKALAFRAAFDTAVQQEEMANGNKPLTLETRTAIAKRLAADYVTEKANHWFTRDSTAPLYLQPADVRARETSKAVPVAGSMTRDVLNQWTRALSDPKSPGYGASMRKLQMWQQGINDDGQPDPTAQDKARAVSAAMGWGN